MRQRQTSFQQKNPDAGKPDSGKPKVLELLEKEEREFRNHWVWKEIGLSPEEFFKKVRSHVEKLNIPKVQWDTMYQKAKEANRVRALEQRQFFRPINLKMLSGIRV